MATDSRPVSRNNRRNYLKAMSGAVLGATFAGCSSQEGNNEQDNGGSGDDTGENGSNGGNSIPDPIKIGTIIPLASYVGKSIEKSVDLAVDELNSNGGILGSQVEAIHRDNEFSPQKSQSIYTELTQSENVNMTTGPWSSENMLAFMNNIPGSGALHLDSASSTSDTTTQVHDNYDQFKSYFRVGPLNSQYRAQSLVKTAETLYPKIGWEKIAVVAEDRKWTEPFSNIITEGLQDSDDVEVVYTERFAGDTTDFSPIHDEMESNDVQGVTLISAHAGMPFIAQWESQQRPYGLGGLIVPVDNANGYEETDGTVQYTWGKRTSGVGGAEPKGINDLAQKYFENVTEREGFGQGLGVAYAGPHAYNAVKVFAEAAEMAGSVDPEEMIPVLEENTFDVTSGVLEFQGQDDEYTHGPVWGEDRIFEIGAQWQENNGTGIRRLIWPDQVANSDYVSPSWI